MMAKVTSQSEDGSDTDDEMLSSVMEAPLLEEKQLKFDLNVPRPMMQNLSIHFVCETASRLLFQTLNWIKSIQAFNLLKYDSQVGLVRNSWSDLFVLGLAQCSGLVSVPSILSLIVSHQQNRLTRDNKLLNIRDITATICKIHEYVLALDKLKITDKEFAYLRAIALFGADRHGVEKLQDKAVSELEQCCLDSNPNDKNRFPRLLLLLSPLRSLQPDTLEDLFFAGLIGNIQIDSVIPYILKMEPQEYQTHIEESSSPVPPQSNGTTFNSSTPPPPPASFLNTSPPTLQESSAGE